MADSRVVFDIIANDKASGAFGSAGRSADNLGSKVSGMGKKAAAAFAIGAAGAGLFAVKLGTDAVAAARESAKVTALTESTIKSMGGAAGLTAKQVADLSTRLSNTTGVDDEVLQSGANLLLTFGNISSKGGVFDKTLALANDMSVALGQDMKASSIQLGKALNDPIKGVSALTKVGVSFTQQQKDQIKALQESGDLLGAQSIILGEVGKQFGGAAAAAATPMDRLRVTVGNLQEKIGEKLIPVIDKVATWLADRLPGALDTVSSAFARVADVVRTVVDTFNEDGLAGVVGMVREAVADALPGIIDTLQGWADAFVDWIGPLIPPFLAELGKVYVAIAEWLYTTALPAIIEKLGEWAGAFINWVAPMIPPLLLELGKLLAALTNWLIFTGLPELLAKMGEWASALLSWVWNAIQDLPAALSEFIATAGRWVDDTAIPYMKTAGSKMALELIRGMAEELGKLPETLEKKIYEMVPALILLGKTIGKKIVLGIFEALNETPLGAITPNAGTQGNSGGTITGKALGGGITQVGELVRKSGVPYFDDGGVMPGPIGRHSLAYVAGGETVLPTHKANAAGSGVTIQMLSTGGVVTDTVMAMRAAEWQLSAAGR